MKLAANDSYIERRSPNSRKKSPKRRSHNFKKQRMNTEIDQNRQDNHQDFTLASMIKKIDVETDNRKSDANRLDSKRGQL